MIRPHVSLCSRAERSREVVPARAGGRGSKFRKLEEGERSLTKVQSSQASGYFIQIRHQVQTKLIPYEAKNDNLEGLCFAFF